MRRYIDAYALENRVEDFEKLTGMKLDIVHDFVSSQPTVDVVEVVRCGDCKYYAPVNNGDHGYCGTPLGREVYPEDYCSSGELYE